MQVVPLLVPLPTAADNHQYFNARAFEKSGAARVIEQKSSTPEDLAKLLTELVDDETKRQQIKTALAKWYAPEAATQIAQNMVMQLDHGHRHSDQTGAGQKRFCQGNVISRITGDRHSL